MHGSYWSLVISRDALMETYSPPPATRTPVSTNIILLMQSCPDTCTGANCHCASTAIPGGIKPEDAPQFIVLTNDDAITTISHPVIMNITEKFNNINGCKMPATWFVSIQYTDPGLVQDVFVRGHEIATHTVNHVSNPDVNEIVGAKRWLNQTAKIPMEAIQGFRAPFLVFTPDQRAVLNSNGFLYDSSISETYPTASSPARNEMLWPYTMDYGIPQDCGISTGVCTAQERHPGLWEFPMWTIQDSKTNAILASMDPQGDQYELYKAELDSRLSGNRAPLGIYQHAAWLIADTNRATQLEKFLTYASQQPNVWFATVQQVLAWMANPVPASEYQQACPTSASLLSQLPGAKLCIAPNNGCVYGTWSTEQCRCACQNEDYATRSGYCLDEAGSCTIQKGYDFDLKEYVCASPSTPADGPSAETVAPPAVQLDKAECGHSLLQVNGLRISSKEPSPTQYTQAVKGVDGSCSTCAVVDPVNGSAFYTAQLPASETLTGVALLLGSDQTVDVRVGDSMDGNGMTNPVCASQIRVTANSPMVVTCGAKGSVVTVASKGGLQVCDLYPVIPAAASQEDDVAPTTVVVQMTFVGGGLSQARDVWAPAVCQVLKDITGDASATCLVRSVESVDGSLRRRALSAAGDILGTFEVTTINPLALNLAMRRGQDFAAQLQQVDVQIDPASVSAAVQTTPTTDSGDSDEGSLTPSAG
ncbi:hypothetical protein H632_c324p1, partial [Helicosporidium sp. ATCC 50920]